MESIFNIRNSFSERVYYDNLAIKSPIYNILNYFSDSIKSSQDLQREKWMASSKNIYSQISRAFTYKNSAHKIVCVPNFSNRELRSNTVPSKDHQNIVFTAGNDLNIRYWNLSTDKCYHIHNADGRRRTTRVTNTDIIIYHEVGSTEADKTGFAPYQYKNGYTLNNGTSDKQILAQAGHKDVINDILVMDRNEILVTCSRDKTIKVWR